MIRISTQVIPPGGWSHQEPDGRVIRGETYDDLVKNLTADRIANQQVLGNPEKDIQSQQCEKNPQLCFRAGEEQAEEPRPRSFRERVALWAKLRYGRAGEVKLVEQDEADRRASICQKCPRNSQWRDSCQPCVDAVDRTLLLIRQNRKPSPAVLGCDLMGHDNTCATLMPPELLEHRKKYLDAAPDFCWLKEL